MSVQIPTYMLVSGLIAGGMSSEQAIGTILLGNLIVLVPIRAELCAARVCFANRA
jgi:NCS1 family nucleobase:cation symporter-1